MRIIALASLVAAALLVQSCQETTAPRPVVGPGQFTSVSAGGGHACALDTLSRGWCWGSNGTGAVGVEVGACVSVITNGYPGCIILPAVLNTSLRFKEISAGRVHTCALTESGTAYCWGSNGSGQLGTTAALETCNGTPCSSVPVEVAGGFTFKSIAAGAATTCGVTTTGVGKCWGLSLGPIAGPSTAASYSTPVTVLIPETGDSVWISFARPGQSSACGTTAAERPLCWGSPASGQLGLETPPADPQGPAPVGTDLNLTSVTVGLAYGCALDFEGSAHCWGAAERDGLGISQTGTRVTCENPTGFTCYSLPARVGGNIKFASLSAGPHHVCGIVLGLSEARCWNSDIDLAVGRGTEPFVVTAPYPTRGFHPFSTVSAGDRFACGITTDKNVWCWGSNRVGQLGLHPLDGRTNALIYSGDPIAVAPSLVGGQ